MRQRLLIILTGWLLLIGIWHGAIGLHEAAHISYQVQKIHLQLLIERHRTWY